MELSILVSIINLHIMKGSVKHVRHSYFSNMKVFTNIRFSHIRSQSTATESITGSSFVNDIGLTATNITRYLIPIEGYRLFIG